MDSLILSEEREVPTVCLGGGQQSGPRRSQEKQEQEYSAIDTRLPFDIAEPPSGQLGSVAITKASVLSGASTLLRCSSFAAPRKSIRQRASVITTRHRRPPAPVFDQAQRGGVWSYRNRLSKSQNTPSALLGNGSQCGIYRLQVHAPLLSVRKLRTGREVDAPRLVRP